MSYIDIILCIPLVWGIYKGFTKGLIVEAASMVAFILGIWGSVTFSAFLSQKFMHWFSWKTNYLPIISFAVTFIGIIILIYFIAKLIQKLVEGMSLGALNKLGGAVFGVLKFALVISVLIVIIDAIEKSYPIISFKAKNESLLYKPIGKIVPMLIPALDNSKIGAIFHHKESVEGTKSKH